MRWFLPWALVAVTAVGAVGSTPAMALSPAPTATIFTPAPLEDTSAHPQFCKWPCECPSSPPRCPLGVSLITDGCECCKMCAQQLGDNCTEAAVCDPHRGLYCDYSGDSPRYAVGVCAQVVGVGCVLDGVRYNNGQSFQPNCKYNCTCVGGAVGCTPLCLRARPPRVWCRHARRVSVPGRCCEQWVCDDDARRPRKTAPRHTGAFAAMDEVEPWHRNCIAYSSPWSPCSASCGLGVSTRISNVNVRCWPEQESRLCNLRPCDVGLWPHVKVTLERSQGPSEVLSCGDSKDPSPTAPGPAPTHVTATRGGRGQRDSGLLESNAHLLLTLCDHGQSPCISEPQSPHW
nr:WNT1-inducible-signaling pathway protein 1 isoform X5 [Globicephala melas]